MSEAHAPGSTAIEEHGKHPNYVGVFLFLGVLTAIEIGVSQFLIKSPAKVPALLLLALGKGVLVALYYMHLRFDSRIFSFFFTVAIFVLALPFTLIVMGTLGAPTGADKTPPEARVTPSPRPQQAGNEGNTNPSGPPVPFNTTATEFKFDPKGLNVKAGQRVEVTLKNAGALEHTFTLSEANFEVRAQGGQSANGGFIAPPPGTYTFFCSVPGHKEAGMTGTIVVE